MQISVFIYNNANSYDVIMQTCSITVYLIFATHIYYYVYEITVPHTIHNIFFTYTFAFIHATTLQNHEKQAWKCFMTQVGRWTALWLFYHKWSKLVQMLPKTWAGIFLILTTNKQNNSFFKPIFSECQQFFCFLNASFLQLVQKAKRKKY